MAEIIKLDDYLNQYSYSIDRAIVEVLGMNVNDQASLEYARELLSEKINFLGPKNQKEFETRLIDALESYNVNEVQTLLGLNEYDEGLFDYVDVIEGYNFRCKFTNQQAKNGLMDWLEESGYDYLIDNDGNFAIKCNDRGSQYKVTRAYEKFNNRWERPSYGKNIDPELTRQAVELLPHELALRDGVTEDEKDSTSFKDTTHTMSILGNGTQDNEDERFKRKKKKEK